MTVVGTAQDMLQRPRDQLWVDFGLLEAPRCLGGGPRRRLRRRSGHAALPPELPLGEKSEASRAKRGERRRKTCVFLAQLLSPASRQCGRAVGRVLPLRCLGFRLDEPQAAVQLPKPVWKPTFHGNSVIFRPKYAKIAVFEAKYAMKQQKSCCEAWSQPCGPWHGTTIRTGRAYCNTPTSSSDPP